MRNQNIYMCCGAGEFTDFVSRFTNFHKKMFTTFMDSWKPVEGISVENLAVIVPPVLLVFAAIIYLFKNKRHQRKPVSWWISTIKVIPCLALLDLAFILGIIQSKHVQQVADIVIENDPACYVSTFSWKSKECVLHQQLSIMMMSVIPSYVLLYDACTDQLLMHFLTIVWNGVRYILATIATVFKSVLKVCRLIIVIIKDVGNFRDFAKDTDSDGDADDHKYDEEEEEEKEEELEKEVVKEKEEDEYLSEMTDNENVVDEATHRVRTPR